MNQEVKGTDILTLSPLLKNLSSDCIDLRQRRLKDTSLKVKRESSCNSSDYKRYLRASSLTFTSRASSGISSIPSLNRLSADEDLPKRKSVRFSEQLEFRRFFHSTEWSEGSGGRSLSDRLLPKLNFLRKQSQRSGTTFKESCVECLPWQRSMDPIEKAVWMGGYHLRHTAVLESKYTGVFKRFLNEKLRKQDSTHMYFKYKDYLAAKPMCFSRNAYDLTMAQSLTNSEMESVYVSELDLADDEGYSEMYSDWKGYERPSFKSKHEISEENSIYEPIKSQTSCMHPDYIITPCLHTSELSKTQTEKLEDNIPKMHKTPSFKICPRETSEVITTTNNALAGQIFQPVQSTREKQIAFSLSRLTLPTWATERLGIPKALSKQLQHSKSLRAESERTTEGYKSKLCLPRFPRYLLESENSLNNEIYMKQLPLTQH